MLGRGGPDLLLLLAHLFELGAEFVIAEVRAAATRRAATLETNFTRRAATLETSFAWRAATLETSFAWRAATRKTSFTRRAATLETTFTWKAATWRAVTLETTFTWKAATWRAVTLETILARRATTWKSTTRPLGSLRRPGHGRPLILAHPIDDRLDLVRLGRGQLELLRDIRPGDREDPFALKLDLAEPGLLFRLEDFRDRLFLFAPQRIHRRSHLLGISVSLAAPRPREHLPALLRHRRVELLELALLFLGEPQLLLDRGGHDQRWSARSTGSTRVRRVHAARPAAPGRG